MDMFYKPPLMRRDECILLGNNNYKLITYLDENYMNCLV